MRALDVVRKDDPEAIDAGVVNSPGAVRAVQDVTSAFDTYTTILGKRRRVIPGEQVQEEGYEACLLYTSPSPRD